MRLIPTLYAAGRDLKNYCQCAVASGAKDERTRRNKPQTFEELEAELARDPVYQAKRAEHEELARKSRAVYDAAARPLLVELAKAGFSVERIGRLYGSAVGEEPLDYRPVIPLLMEWLPKIDDPDVRDDIVRALTVKWAKPAAARLLVDEFEKVGEAKDPITGGRIYLRWAIGSALEVVADESVYDDLVRLATAREYGTDRRMIVMGLGNMKKRRDEAIRVLVGSLKDEDVAGHALIALRRLNATEARSAIEPFLTHERKWWRDEAKKAIAKFDKAKQRSA